MVTEPSADSSSSLAEACQLLRQFLCLERLPAPPDAIAVRAAVHQVAAASDYQIFGICADTAAQAEAALHQFLQALDYSRFPPVPSHDGPLYVKYNPATQRLHTDGYDGTHRGVLVSCQSAEPDGVNETFGHLPLDLFAADG